MLTPLEAAELLRRASFQVRIEKNAKGIWEWGSAFFVTRDGYALTAFHNLPAAVVAAGGGTIAGMCNDREISLECLVARSVSDKEGDIALLKWNAVPPCEVPHVAVGGLDPQWDGWRRVDFWQDRPSCILGFPFENEGMGERIIAGRMDAQQPLYTHYLHDRGGAGANVIARRTWMRFAAGDDARDLEGISGAALLDLVSGKVVAVEHRYDPKGNPGIIYCTESGPHADRLKIPFDRICTVPRDYLDWVSKEKGWIDIRGLRVVDQKVNRFPIEDLYTPLTTVSLQERAGAEGGGPGQRQAPLQEALQHRLLVLLGDPGGGKTTFLNRIAYAACQALLGEKPAAWAGLVPGVPCPWPVFLKANRLAAYIGKHSPEPHTPSTDAPEWLIRFVLEEHAQLDAQYSRGQFGTGCLLLVDGLDEISGDAARRNMASLLQHTAQAYTGARIVTSSRPPAYVGKVVIADFACVRIGPLEKAAVETFVNNWCGCVHGKGTPQALAHRQDLLGQIEAKPAIREMAVNPVMLTALAALHWNDRRLPDDRWELYDSVLKWLAQAREDMPGRLLPKQCLKMMRRLALGMQADPRGRQVEVTRREAAEILAPSFPGSAGEAAVEVAERFLVTEETDSGIVVGREGRTPAENTVRFWHLTFQEFLAALELADDRDARGRWLFDGQNLYRTEWREVVLLLAATLLNAVGTASAEEYFREVLDGLEPRGLAGWLAKLRGRPTLAERARSVGLIGMALRDLRASGYRLEDPRYEEHLKKVLAIFETREAAGIPFETRLAAADALGQAGDPRLEDEGGKWVRLKGGEYWMGAQKEDPGSPNYDAEAPAVELVRRVTVGPFEIGRYPVTVREYGKFVKGEEYGKAEWWRAGGFGEYEGPEDWGRQERYANRPVVGVSWYEAMAYSEWAGWGGVGGYEARADGGWAGGRLLTEEEWEYAARDGESGKRYPWGREAPGPRLANIGGQGPGHPTPVGLYPGGATGSGVQDMAGNVWEWTGSLYRGGSENRVVRGGSWSVRHASAACAFRDHYHPGIRFNFYGFRCART
ncbi:MAG: SUMF1/EgtB/PvdO family nonheme iron enzyme [Candidatus Solibacter sp.]|nr:SUMF1/EgtB/PvdO family nonheme iron enzyme [Candidatus Solibacter sp.]